jgi:hypothetical protein
MSINVKEAEDAWLANPSYTARVDFGLLNWTIESLRTNFLHHYVQGKSPYQTLKSEGYTPLGEK